MKSRRAQPQSGSGESPTQSKPIEHTRRCVPLLALLAAVTACSAPPPQIVGEPTLTMNPNGTTPLSGVLIFTTDSPARATLTIGDAESSITVTPAEEFGTDHEVPVLGLRHGRLNTVELSVTGANGDAGDSRVFEVETDSLDDMLPPINVSLSRPGRMEPGVTLVPLFTQGEQNGGVAVILDAQGDIVWVWTNDAEYSDLFRLSNGNLVAYYNQGRRDAVEMDMLGNVVRSWYTTGIDSDDRPEGSIAIPTDTIHHDLRELPSGNFLALSSERRHFDAYVSSTTDRDAPLEPKTLIGDVLVEFDPDSGEILREWKLFDLLDPYHFGYESLDTNYWSGTYEEVTGTPVYDWTHTNSVAYDASSDSVIMSVRKLSAVVRLDLGSGEIEWILGDPTGWREPWRDLLLDADGPLEWAYGHHAAYLTPAGTIMLYDNGSYGRAAPWNPQLAPESAYSRVVEYAVDAASRTVSQVWNFGGTGDEHFYSAYLSEADWQPATGNVLITHGGMIRTNDGGFGSRPRDGRNWMALTEVTHTTPAEKVWEVIIDDPAAGWGAYRAERLASLYP